MMYWVPTECPKCKSTNIQHEVDIPVKFTFSNANQVVLSSTMEEVFANIDKELSDGDVYCKCLDCNYQFWS